MIQHIIVYSSVPGSVPRGDSDEPKARHMHQADCSCYWGTPLGDTRDELDHLVISHLRKVGQITG